MPKSDTSDGNTSQFDKLKAMRKARDGDAPTTVVDPAVDPAPGASPEEIAAENARLRAGEPVGGEPPTVDDDEGDDGDGDEPVVEVAAHTRAKPDKKEEITPPPGTEAIEMDGRTVFVAPELAEAYRESQKIVADDAAAAAHQKIVDEVTQRVTATLPTTPTPAQIAAEKALADALAQPEVPMPDANLQITDPTKFAEQLQAHIADKADRTMKKALADKEARDAATVQAKAAMNEEQQEAYAREVLGTQFFNKYPTLSEPATKELVDVLLNKKWNEIAPQIRKNPPKTGAEGEALKKKIFVEIAAAATKQIVAIRGGGAAKVVPPPPPPALATSTTRAATPPKKPADKPRTKFPEGSMSSILKNHQSKKAGATA